MKKANATMMVACRLCEHQDFYLGDHVLEAHGLSVPEYQAQFPSAPTVAKELVEAYDLSRPAPKRARPPALADLTVKIAGVPFQVYAGVPASACLPLPPAYRLPKSGLLAKDIQHAVVSLCRRRSIYVWGLPGSGKDALFHYFSWATRTPAAIFQIQPGTDIQSWFFSRSFDKDGTSWEEGEMLKAARDGYLCEDGTRVPMLILVSDFDRADKSQAEYMRLITDSISGRIKGPNGTTYNVLPGTIIVATANSSGAGDERNRCISSNPLDASLLDRFDRKYEFHYMEWDDEKPVICEKFPLVSERVPDFINTMGKITVAMRAQVEANELYCEFSHRAVCSIVGHADDILFCTSDKKVPGALMRKALRAWVDGLPDSTTREEVKKVIDSFVDGGVLDEGDISHIKTGKEKLA